MSLIGTLDQFSLANVLQRVEAHKKTGLLVLKQGAQWVEFYLRDGQLLCIGPVRTSASLGERLLHDGVISYTVLQETVLVIGNAEQSETRFALTLMHLGYVSREELRAWAIRKAVDVLEALLPWNAGEIYFEEGTPPPADRLLASMQVSSLIASASLSLAHPPLQPDRVPFTQPVQPRPAAPQVPVPHVPQVAPVEPLITPAIYSTLASHNVEEQSEVREVNPSTHVSRVPTLMDASQFIDDASFSPSALFAADIPNTEAPVSSFPSTESFLPIFDEPDVPDFSSMGDLPPLAEASPPSSLPVPVMNPVPPTRIDTTFMRPDMVLIPLDLSGFRDQNPQIQITPDQWRVLTRVDGRTTLHVACQELSMLPELVCQVAGELMADGLIHVALPEHVQLNDNTLLSRDATAANMHNGYVTPGYAASVASSWSASVPVLPSSDVAPQFPSSLPFETQSQWGNGGNGATFVPGRGWITSPQSMQPLPSGPLDAFGSGVYAPVKGNGS